LEAEHQDKEILVGLGLAAAQLQLQAVVVGALALLDLVQALQV
jgi:hypothetical protein